MRRLAPLLLCFALAACAQPGAAPDPAPSGLPWCASIPGEASDTIALIHDGGPFPYPDNDDKRFGNYERLLPDEPSGYYREYTVDTPGLGHRGARRVITGGTSPIDVYYYTNDHYQSFCQITDQQIAEAPHA